MFADYRLQLFLQAARVLRDVAGHIYRRVETEDVAAFDIRPQRETRDHCGPGVSGDLREPCI